MLVGHEADREWRRITSVRFFSAAIERANRPRGRGAKPWVSPARSPGCRNGNHPIRRLSIDEQTVGGAARRARDSAAGHSGRSRALLWEKPPAALQDAVEQVRPFFGQAAATARDEKQPLADRLAAMRLLGHGPFATAAPVLQDFLTPQQPGDVQLATVRALALHDNPKAAEILLAGWAGQSPSVRREVVEALFARADRLAVLLTAIEQKKVAPGQLEPFRIDQLRKHPDAKLRARAQKLLAGLTNTDRGKVVESYRDALDLKADAGRGKAVFMKTCATCHRAGPTPGDDRVLPGAELGGVTERPSYWGGAEVDLLRALGYCQTRFMGVDAPLSASTAEALLGKRLSTCWNALTASALRPDQ